jgi:hypothetical protein
MAFFLAMIVLLLVVVVPVVIFTVARVVPRVVDRSVPIISAAPSPELDARLSRIEDAIDAMAVEIERLRTGELPAESAPRRLPNSPSD